MILNRTFYLKRHLAHEDELIGLFRQDQHTQNLKHLSKPEWERVLIQSAHVSLNFISWYDRLLVCLENQRAKSVIRTILDDETPREAPSHREDLFADLAFMGISKEKVFWTPLTDCTKKTIKDLNSLVVYVADPTYDLKSMVGVRMAGEILVAEGYGLFLPELKQHFGLTEDNSRFYWPHYLHDKKDGGGGDHTNSFESVLEEMIVDEQTLVFAKESANKAFKARIQFYSQFEPRTAYDVKNLKKKLAALPDSERALVGNIEGGLDSYLAERQKMFSNSSN